MTHELTWLAAVSLLTGSLWMPYILNRLAVGRGLLHEVGYPDRPTPLSPWAERLKRAHQNAVENLVVFAPLILATHLAGVSDGVTQASAIVYFWARVAHAGAYTLAIPWVRTLAFTAGWLCQVALALRLLLG